MPIGSIRENHLKQPGKYPDPGDEVEEMLTLLREYLVVSQHLRKISKHPYTSGYPLELNELEDWLERLRTFQFDEGQVVGRRQPRQ